MASLFLAASVLCLFVALAFVLFSCFFCVVMERNEKLSNICEAVCIAMSFVGLIFLFLSFMTVLIGGIIK